MRLIPAALILGLVALLPASGSAQSLQSFGDVARQVSPGSRVRVDERSGASTLGRLVTITAEQLTLQTSGGERRFEPDAVAAIAVRRTYAKRGALLGAAVGAALCIPCTTGEHADRDAPVLTGLLGAGLGAVAGALIPRMQIVYRAGAGQTSPGAAIAISLSW